MFTDVLTLKFATAFAPLLLHEFGHIKTGFLERLQVDPLCTIFGTRLEKFQLCERLADKYAATKIEQQITKNAVYESGDHAIFADEGTRTVASIMRHIGFCSRFGDFRKMLFTQIGSQLIYSRIPTCENLSKLYLQESIENIYESLLPIVSDDELKTMRARDGLSYSVHSDTLSRSQLFSNSTVDDLELVALGHTTFSSQVRSIFSKNLSSVSSAELEKAYALDINRIYPGMMKDGISPPSSFLSTISDLGLTGKPSSISPFEECTIYSDDQDIYLELGYVNRKIVYATLYIHAYSMREFDDNSPYSGPPTESSVSDFVHKFKVLTTLVDCLYPSMEKHNTKGKGSDLRRFYDYLLNHAACPYTSFRINNSRFILTISPHVYHKSIFLTFIHK